MRVRVDIISRVFCVGLLGEKTADQQCTFVCACVQFRAGRLNKQQWEGGTPPLSERNVEQVKVIRFIQWKRPADSSSKEGGREKAQNYRRNGC